MDMRRFKNCQEPAYFEQADELLELIAAQPAGVERRELTPMFREIADKRGLVSSDTMGMKLLGMLEYAGAVVVHRDSPNVIRLVRVRKEA
jgi:hypothetical protein